MINKYQSIHVLYRRRGQLILLMRGLEGSEITTANLKIAQSSSLEEAMKIGREAVGHYSTGEMLEIRHPRLKDDEAALYQYVSGIFNSKEQYVVEFNNQKLGRINKQEELLSILGKNEALKSEFQQVVSAEQTYMALRETVKYQFVKEYALLRNALVEIAHKSNISESEIFSLYPNEIVSFIDNSNNFTAKIKERQERFQKYQLVSFPPVIRESDIDSIGNEEIDDSQNSLELFGKLLAQGRALEEAIIVNIEDFETVEAARDVLLFYKKQALPIVLVASQMNLSHDPLIMQADGIMIENAGLVSHGAQRARELGRGAIGGVKAKLFKTGDHINFNPSMKKIIRNTNEI